MRPKAYSYARWSSVAQGESGESERRQLEAAQAYAKRHGYDLDTSHIDRGKSGYKGHHRKAALGRFLEGVRTGVIAPGSVLIIESLDRLSREPVADALELFMELTKSITVVTLFDGVVYSRSAINADFSKLLVPIIKMSVAWEESHKKSERKLHSYAAKRREGETITSVCPGWLVYNAEADRFEEVAYRGEIVRRIFSDLLTSGAGVIASRLNAAGEPSWGPMQRIDRNDPNSERRAPSWHPSMIKKLLEDRRVIGEFQPHVMVEGRRVPAGDPRPGYYPQTVSPDLYHRAKAAVAARLTAKTGGRKGVTFSNLFAGLATCDACGGPMVYRNKGQGPKGGVYLTCGAAARAHKCGNHRHYGYAEIEGAVLHTVTDVDLTEARTVNLTGKLEGALAEARVEADRLAARSKRITKLLIDGEDDADLLRERQETKEARVDVEAKIERLQADLATARATLTPQGCQEALRRLREQMATAEPADLYRLRAAFSAGLRDIVDMMVFRPEAPVDLIMGAGVKNYRITVEGDVEIVDLTRLALAPDRTFEGVKDRWDSGVRVDVTTDNGAVLTNHPNTLRLLAQ